MTARNYKVHACISCGELVHRRGGQCRACHLRDVGQRHRQRLTCPECGGRKRAASTLCRACFKRNATTIHRVALLRRTRHIGFDLQWFRERMADLAASPLDVARWAGLNPSTIRKWLAMERVPSAFEWRAVQRALDLVPCQHCGGSGLVPAERQERAG